MFRVNFQVDFLLAIALCLAFVVQACSVNAADQNRLRQSVAGNQRGSMEGRIDLSQARPVNRRSTQPNRVQKVGFLEDYSGGCGPVCGCETCTMQPGCGLEAACGFEPGCGIESRDGIEPGCGLERACGGCGIEGCSSCGEPACGAESYGLGSLDGCINEGGCGGCGQCDQCCSNFDSLPIFLPILRPMWCRFDFFAGVQGYKGPMNSAPTATNVRTGSGSFGFYQGFNEGRSLRRLFGWDMAAQFGLRATQTNPAGTEFTDQTRHQIFLTGGLFRRVDYGLQYGLVVDYLNDDWYFNGNLVQLRGELSWKTAACHEFGFQFMSGVSNDSSTTVTRNASGATFQSLVSFEPTDQYRAFYRQQMQNSGYWDAFVGGTNHNDTVIGTTMSLPVRRRLLVQAGATYLIPSGGTADPKFEQEGWNISLGVVFRPGGPTGCGRYDRPMFDVADNGTFMVDRR